MSYFLQVLLYALILYLITKKIPELVSGLLSGNPSLSGGNFKEMAMSAFSKSAGEMSECGGKGNFGANALSLANAAGGKNAPLAHYEPSNVVINLTKNKGAGSLGHEFFHALDNYFSKKIFATNNSMVTEQIKNNAIFEEDDAALVGFQMLKKTLSNTELVKRSEKLDKMKGKKYWSLESEMSARAFEFYLIQFDFTITIKIMNFILRRLKILQKSLPNQI